MSDFKKIADGICGMIAEQREGYEAEITALQQRIAELTCQKTALQQVVSERDKEIERLKASRWQLCPKCGGNGFVPAPSYSSSSFTTCDVCQGKKVLAPPALNCTDCVLTDGAWRNRAERLVKVLKIYANESEWTQASSNDPWRLLFNSTDQDGDGWTIAQEALVYKET